MTVQPNEHPQAAPEPVTEQRVLTVGDQQFVLAPNLPMSIIVRYAGEDNGLVMMNKLINKVVHPDDHDRFWDTWEQAEDKGMDIDALMSDISKLYADRPTARP